MVESKNNSDNYKKVAIGVIIAAAVLLLIAGYMYYSNLPKNFKVVYNGARLVDGGRNNLDVTYTVQDGKITDCTGVYTENRDGSSNLHGCDFELILNNSYDVPLNGVVYRYPLFGELNGTYISEDGKEGYKWQILA